MIDPADAIAIKRAFDTCGRDSALAELLRLRFPVVKADRAESESALDHILALPADIPEVRRGDRRPFPGPQSRPRKRRP